MPESVDLSASSLYINRELSLLEFQRRVLEEALDERNPLLERVKFMAIFGSNMDEFFMLRVSNLQRRIAENGQSQELIAELAEVRTLACDLYTAAVQCLHQEIFPKLEKSGIRMLNN